MTAHAWNFGSRHGWSGTDTAAKFRSIHGTVDDNPNEAVNEKSSVARGRRHSETGYNQIMCGRASQLRAKRFGQLIAHWLYPEAFEPKHNLRPTEPAWIVARRADGYIKTLQAKWWCQRDGANRFETKFPTFNARVDTRHEKKLWADLLQKGQRCIFPIDSFYEWPIKGKGLPPVEIFVKGREPYALAGLWSRWFEGNETRYSFSVFTTESNEFMKPIHEKAMPVILGDIESQERWLSEGDESVLRPYGGEMEFDQLPDTLEKLYPEENPKK